MITNVIESKHDGKPFWRIRSFLSFLCVCLSYEPRVLIGLNVRKDGDYDLTIVYHGLSRGHAFEIVSQFTEFDRATSTNLESIDRRVILPD